MVKNDNSPEELSKSEREELIALRRRNEYLEAENAYLKNQSLGYAKDGIDQGEKVADTFLPYGAGSVSDSAPPYHRHNRGFVCTQ